MAAVAATGRGWAVFPLTARSKRPAITRWEHAATSDPGLAQAWWTGDHAGANIGIACGPSRLVALDLDTARLSPAVPEGVRSLTAAAALHGQPFPGPTYTVATPSGGQHLYFTAPATQLRNSTGRLGPHIDTRASGGYVVAAGSVTAAGAYETVCDRAPVALPAWIAGALLPPQRTVTATPCPAGAGRASRYLAAAVRNETCNVANAAPGSRHDTLLRAAVALGRLVAGGALGDAETREALLSAAAVHEADGFTAAEAERTISDAFRYASRRPRYLRQHRNS